MDAKQFANARKSVAALSKTYFGLSTLAAEIDQVDPRIRQWIREPHMGLERFQMGGPEALDRERPKFERYVQLVQELADQLGGCEVDCQKLESVLHSPITRDFRDTFIVNDEGHATAAVALLQAAQHTAAMNSDCKEPCDVKPQFAAILAAKEPYGPDLTEAAIRSAIAQEFDASDSRTGPHSELQGEYTSPDHHSASGQQQVETGQPDSSVATALPGGVPQPPNVDTPADDTSEEEPERPTRGMTWQEVLDKALDYLKTKPWPGRNRLAETLGCSRPTLDKACKRDAKLARIRAEYEEQERVKSVSSQMMTDAVTDSMVAKPECSELDHDLATLTEEESDSLIARLKAQCQDEKSQKEFAAMTESDRLKAAIIANSDPDTGNDVQSMGGRVRTR